MAATYDPDGAFIRMLGERGDVATLMQGLDVVCLTSGWQECLSVVMLEAMAASKAFVAPRTGSLDEALVDGVTGRFFEPLTPDALAAVLIELLDDPAQRDRLGQRARQKVRAEFSVDRMARAFESLVSRLCERQVHDG
jgi:glycosyltransferase involved in cell wall biosynthesis